MFIEVPYQYCLDGIVISERFEPASYPPCLDGNTHGSSASWRFAAAPIDVRGPMRRMWIPMDSTVLTEHPEQDGTGETRLRYLTDVQGNAFSCIY